MPSKLTSRLAEEMDMVDQRRGERRNGDRRLALRSSPDRRRGDRRQLAAAAALTLSFLGLERPASAQIYTRTNTKGLIEATNVPEDSGDYRLAYPKRKGIVIHSPEFRLRPMPYSAFNDHIEAAATLYGVSADFVRAVIQTESQFDPGAVSSVGAQGLMQLMPATARRFGVVNAFDAQQNIFGGVRYLRFLLDKFGGDHVLAAAGYNAGENAVVRYGGVPPYRETQGYVRKVMAILGSGGSDPAPVTGEPTTVTLASYTPNSAPVGGEVRAAAGESAGAGLRTKAVKPRTLYRWIDSQGVPHMTETPPVDGSDFVALRGGG
jgi:hypothetical protein